MCNSNGNNQQTDINKIIDDIAFSKKKIFLAKENLKRLVEKEESLLRYFNSENPEHVKLKNKLVNQKETINGNLKVYNEELSGFETAYEDGWKQLVDESDPELYLNRLDSKYPILMMPLRIETRFKKVKSKAGNKEDQLWVRVFPDDCSIDTFEEILSESEIENAQDFWADWLIAAGDEIRRRGAWRTLVDSHGAGRAQYIFNRYRPYDSDDILSSSEDSENPPLYLVIQAVDGLITDDEKIALKTYWIQIWRANGNIDKINEANDEFAYGREENRVRYLIENFAPKNIDDDFSDIDDRYNTEIEVRFVIFPADDKIEIQSQTLAHAPKVKLMSERLYLLGYREDRLKAKKLGEPIPFPLICGPDPQAEEKDLEDYLDGDLKITKGMKWMVDFDTAVKNGLGFIIDNKVDQDGQVASGYDRLIVVGVRLSADKEKGKELIEELFQNHYNGNSGLEFLSVGTPTNNIEESESGYTGKEDADDSFDQMFNSRKDDVNDEVKSWWSESDRHWFTKLLGISPEIFDNTINTDGYDQREARAMNIALWPATWGYFFDTMMQPVLNEDQIEKIRWYFNHFVVGRGTIPSIRIDDQPYGILPTTVFSRIDWFKNYNNHHYKYLYSNEIPIFLNQLYEMCKKIQSYWKEMSKSISNVGKDGDPHQLLLDIIGLHGGSVEFHKRFGESLNHLWNLYFLNQEEDDAYIAHTQYIKAIINTIEGTSLLKNLGYKGEIKPEILEKLYVLIPEELKGPLIDDQPLSEINPIRQYTDEGENYIKWLIDAAKNSLETLRKETGFKDNIRPNALLYLMLNHAMELGYFDAGLQLYKQNMVLKKEVLHAARIEPDFIHIRDNKNKATAQSGESISNKPVDRPFYSESRYYFLYQKETRITNDVDKTVAEYIPEILGTKNGNELYIWDQIKALEHLKSVPTARLQRLFVEHLDCATYRFDAWKWGLINYQLLALRNRKITDSEEETETANGLYIGAYGWLENVRSEYKTQTPINLKNEELNNAFNPTDDNPIMRDNSNYGYIQAPSLNHAVTASLLRNAYLSRATKENAELYGINLSSERIRKALSILEGIQNGQNLAALLGYQFERFIHDNNLDQNVDRLIYPLRRQFPLASNQMASTEEKDPDVPIEALEARNVVNGSDLIGFVEKRLGPNDEPNYINDLQFNSISNYEKTIIIQAIEHIRDTNDAVADLGMAECIHQILQGNIDRAAGTLDTYSKGNYPQMPDVIQTPRSGVNITHRIGLQIDSKATYNDSNSPRAMAEPGLNSFLRDILPELTKIICAVSFKNSDTNTEVNNLPISMQILDLQPIDLLYIINDDVDQAMTNLDDLVIHWVRNQYGNDEDPPARLRPDTEIKISYYVKEKKEEEISVFELIPLIKYLRAILLRSRPLRPTDVSLSNESKEQLDENVFLETGRVTNAFKYINTQIDDNGDDGPLILFIKNLEQRWDGEKWDDEAEIINQVDENLEDLVAILYKLSFTGMSHTGFGFAYDWKRQQMTNLLQKIRDLLERWNKKNADYETLMSSYDPDGTGEEKLNILMKAERLISTQPTLNPDPETFLNDILLEKKNKFGIKKDEFEIFLNSNHQGIAAAFSTIESANILSYEEFDLVSTDINDIKKACLLFSQDLFNKAKLLQEELERRIKKYAEINTDISAANQSKQVQLIEEMAKLLLTDDFKMIPGFDLPEEKKNEWANALNKVNQLLSYQKDILDNPLPVDDWLYGIARVREKMGHFEQVTCWAEGFKDLSIDLLPVQLPCLDPYCWFALEFGDVNSENQKALDKIFRENDHLLYTAYYHTEFDVNERQCGLLIDEWTEVIPTEEETAGIAFHYDRPNSEPPQTILLATSPQLNENWKWEDLVDAIYETLDEAKLRAVEPEQIDETGFANFVPATISTVTKHPISIMMNYAINNQSLMAIQEQDHE